MILERNRSIIGLLILLCLKGYLLFTKYREKKGVGAVCSKLL